MQNATIIRTPMGQHELKLQGQFTHPHWVAFLFAGLAHSRVSVISGRAFQNEAKIWETRLILDFTASSASPDRLDYVRMALQKPVTIDLSLPVLGHYTVRRREGELDVRVEAPDQMGFLGRLLSRFALLTLYPSEIEINTLGGMIRDRIVLKGFAGAVPSDDVHLALENMLAGLKASGRLNSAVASPSRL